MKKKTNKRKGSYKTATIFLGGGTGCFIKYSTSVGGEIMLLADHFLGKEGRVACTRWGRRW